MPRILSTMRRIVRGERNSTDGEVGARTAAAAAGRPGRRSASSEDPSVASVAVPPPNEQVPIPWPGLGLDGHRTDTPTLISSTKKRRSGANRKGGNDVSRPSKRTKRDGALSGTSSPPSDLSEQSSDECDSSNVLEADDPQICSTLLRRIPPEVIGMCLSYLSTSRDRHSLQTTSRLFRTLSNSPKIVSQLSLGGHPQTARGALITDDDDPDSAVRKLVFFGRGGNLEAVYMLGIIRSYCYNGAHYGIALLRYAANRGCARSSYALGLILRDSYREESKRWLTKAANANYMPAWQEILPAHEMKARFGDLDADSLRSYLDPASLNRLLARHYLKSTSVRTVHTSHCWNPLCGRWAYKATTNINSWLRSREAQDPVPSFMEFLPDLHCCPAAATTEAASRLSESSSEMAADREAATGGAGGAGGGAVVLPQAAAPRIRSAPSPAPGAHSNGTSRHAPDGREAWYLRVSRMKMCSSCRRAKYCSKLCQVYDWRSGRHKMECQFL